MKRVFEKSKSSILDKTRAVRTRWDALISDSTGKSSKQRKCRVGLVEDPPEERERNLEIYMRLVVINGIRTVMEAIDKIDPEFVECRVVEAEDVSTAFKREYIGGSDHLFGGTPEQVEDGVRGVTMTDGKRRVAGLVEKLEAAGITCRSFSVFSVATMLAIILSGASVRPEDFFFLQLKTIWYDREVGEEGEGILKIGMPIDAKQTGEADRDLSKVCKFHDIERWRWLGERCPASTAAGE